MAGQREKSLDERLAMASANQRALNAEVRALADELGVGGIEAKPKARARAIEKFEQDQYGEHAELADLARATFTISTAEQADAIVARLRQIHPLFDKGWAEGQTGYLDRKLLLRFDNGGVAEIQIIPEKVHAFKEHGGGHDAYEISRDVTRPDNEVAAARAFEREGYAAARAGGPFEDFGRLERSASGNMFRNAASDMGTPSAPSLAVNGDLNAPAGVSGTFQRPSDQTQPTPSTRAQGRSSSSSSSTVMDASEANLRATDADGNMLAARAADVRGFDDPAGLRWSRLLGQFGG